MLFKRFFRVRGGLFFSLALLLLMGACQGDPADSDDKAGRLPEVELPEAKTSDEGWTFGSSEGDSESFGGGEPEEGVMMITREALPSSSAGEEAKVRAEPEVSEEGGAEALSPDEAKSVTGSLDRTTGVDSAKRGASGLSAGFSDDNEQFNYYLQFLKDKRDDVEARRMPVADRIVFRLEDKNGRSVPRAEIIIAAKDRILERGRTTARGRYLFFPGEYQAEDEELSLSVLAPAGLIQDYLFDPRGRRTHTLTLSGQRQIPDALALDVVFVMDTTGSMGEEIERLRTMIEIIHTNLRTLSVQPEIRFGMVLYKDKMDAYRTKGVQLTGDLDQFQAALNEVTASGGGDLPEDLEAALFDTLERIQWNPRAVKLVYVVTDAPPQLGYEDLPYGYDGAARRAKREGIKIHTIGTGGLNLQGEYILRQIAQQTGGRYIFLTYGEEGESEGGRPGSVSHHTGANFETDHLESIIINFTREELSWLTDEEITLESGYFEADSVDFEESRSTLLTLCTRLTEQLYNYAPLSLETPVPVVLGGIRTPGRQEAVKSEYLMSLLRQSAVDSKLYQVLERERLDSLLEEWELQQSSLFSPENAKKLKELTAAEVMILGDMFYRDDRWELTLNALRIETGEILSAARGMIDPALLP